MISRISWISLVFLLGCNSAQDPCNAANHCSYGADGAPTCDPGYEWQDPNDPENLSCVSACGNGLLDLGEACDLAELGNATCENLGFGAGQLRCGRSCTSFDFTACGAPNTCGNQRVDVPEVCDGDEVGTVTCAVLGMGQGTVTCLPNCGGYDTTECGTSSCTENCTGRVCGPDPVCGESCGTCTNGSCNASGQCETASADAPTILSLQTNTSVVTQNGTLVVTAMVTDPNGIDDLIGGSLVDPTTNGSYGAFATSAQEGSYTLSLPWSEINEVKAITATTPLGTQRTLRAKFYDQAGHSSSKDVTVTLKCSYDGYTPCSGSCVDLETSLTHCGGCGQAVPPHAHCADGMVTCNDGFNLCGSQCIDEDDFGNCGSCGHSCATVAAAHDADNARCVHGKCVIAYSTTASLDCGSACAEVGLGCPPSVSWEVVPCDGNVEPYCILYEGDGCSFERPYSYTSGWCGQSDVPEAASDGGCAGTFQQLTCSCSE